MVSSVGVILLEVGVFGNFPFLLLAWVSSVIFLVSYVLWARVLVSLVLLLVGGSKSVGNVCSSSSCLLLLHKFCIVAIISWCFFWLSSWFHWLACLSSCLITWLNCAWSCFMSCLMDKKDAPCVLSDKSNLHVIWSKHCSSKPVFVVTVLTLVLMSFSCVVIWLWFWSVFASGSRCRLRCCPIVCSCLLSLL